MSKMRRIHRPTRALTHLALTLGALSLAGCNGAFWGNLVVLGITVGIFFGTLGLGRSAPSSAEASTSTQSGRSS